MFCTHCGKIVKEGSAFCSNCGKPLKPTTAEPARATASSPVVSETEQTKPSPAQEEVKAVQLEKPAEAGPDESNPVQETPAPEDTPDAPEKSSPGSRVVEIIVVIIGFLAVAAGVIAVGGGVIWGIYRFFSRL